MRDLWAVGTAHRRTPDPTPEVDPWEDADPIDGPRDDAVVVFRGLPCVEVHLFADGEDTVTVEQCVDFDIPRCETLALVDALLAGDAQIGMRGGRLRFVRDWLQPFYGLQLVVPVAGREPYRQRVPYQPLQHWISTLSVVPVP
ncbi:hypothetical protein [Pengzhenrongella frigida]|uniref:Uncharacterized protein n=1 Tax=Pengzhenrongella frigida TaxID=1259133 RepID=A0A4Q5MZ59_9MICO|nr:hypothetical protein [Cellulomonas sp. HLT2-17]RYV49527.1 hypothetical protein EUA98_18290 [Cellulomonas sp. HLT2-17]